LLLHWQNATKKKNTHTGPQQRRHSQIRVQRVAWPHVTVSHSKPPPTWRTRSPYSYPPGTGWLSYIPRHWVPFSLPPTTRPATVAAFDPTSTRGGVLPRSSSILACVFVAAGMFTEPLPSNRRLLWLHYCGLQASCHNIICQIGLLASLTAQVRGSVNRIGTRYVNVSINRIFKYLL
jgi:hypothetical protein